MPIYTQLAKWLGPQASLSELGDIKRALAERGVNSRGWRLYLDYGDALFSPLGDTWFSPERPYSSGRNAVTYLKLLQACEMDVLPPWQLLATMRRWGIPDNVLSIVQPYFFRAAWKASVAAEYGEYGLDGFLEAELVPLAQWFFSSEVFATFDDARLKAGLEPLKRMHREWWVQQAKWQGTGEWPIIVPLVECDGFRFAALTSESALVEEGEAMSHCVGDYGKYCRSQPLSIYSIRSKRTGQRFATLSVLETRSGYWEIDQLKGPHDAEVDVHIWRAVPFLLDVLGRESLKDSAVRRYLDVLRSLSKPLRIEEEEDICVF